LCSGIVLGSGTKPGRVLEKKNIFASLTLRYDSIDLLKFMLPDFLIDNFEIVSATNSEENLHLYFEETKPPKEFNAVN
jgi:hypothetical protein